MGPCCGSTRKEASLGVFTRWSSYCDSVVRLQQDHMAIDPVQVPCWRLCRLCGVGCLPLRSRSITHKCIPQLYKEHDHGELYTKDSGKGFQLLCFHRQSWYLPRSFVGYVQLILAATNVGYNMILTHLGGALASPADQYPSVFGGIYFFEEFPYAVPTIFVGLIAASAALVSWLYLKEVCFYLSITRLTTLEDC